MKADTTGDDRHGDAIFPPLPTSILITAVNLCRAVSDLCRLLAVPQRPSLPGKVAFLVHPRDERDIYRQYPAFRYFGTTFAAWVGLLLPPLRLSRVDIHRAPCGFLYTHGIVPHMMIRFPKWSALVSCYLGVLAAKDRAQVIGMAALLPSLTRYGLLLQPRLRHARVTNGHAYTATVIIRQLARVAEARGLSLEHSTVAICGAAGSTGQATARGMVAMLQRPIKSLLLIDKRLARTQGLANELRDLHPNWHIEIDSDLAAMVRADYIIVVTNSPDAIIRPDYLKDGAVIVDDSQPRNTDPRILIQRPDVTVIDVLAEVPGLDVHFDWGLLNDRPNIIFPCLAEASALVLSGQPDAAVVGHVSAEHIVRIEQIATKVSIAPAPITSFYRLLDVRKAFHAEGPRAIG
jgi:fatty aldehyde-generating acyl-ACP reductase